MGRRFKDPRPKSVDCFADAVDWLFLNTAPDLLQSIIEDGAPLNSAMLLILDLYWINEAKLRHEMHRRWYPERYGRRMGEE